MRIRAAQMDESVLMESEIPSMKLTTIQLKRLHRRSALHLADLALHKFASCFYCCESFAIYKISQRVDCGLTAMCPKCGIDAVLPGVYEKPVLELMRTHFFDSHS